MQEQKKKRFLLVPSSRRENFSRMLSSYALFILLILALFSRRNLCESASRSPHHCIHDSIMSSTISPSSLVDIDTEMSKRTVVVGPLRILFDTSPMQNNSNICSSAGQIVNIYGESYKCTTNDILTPQILEFIETQLLQVVSEYFTSTLQVSQIQGNLTFSNSTQQVCGCENLGGVTLPSQYFTSGVSADLVVFVTAYSTEPLASTSETPVGFGCPCFYASSTYRPLAGYINFGPNALATTDSVLYNEMLGIAMHDFTHVLGFTQSLFHYYQGENITNAFQYYPLLPPHPIYLLSTPTLVKNARNYYNCSSLEGVELESSSGPGTIGSHWERRITYNEYMSSSSSYNPIRSILTLSALQDSGWYTVNFSNAQELLWGKNEGCLFAEDRCNLRSSPYNCPPYVSGPAENCNFDGTLKGICNVVEFTAPLPMWYNYYGDPNVAGYDDLADYCGFYSYKPEYQGDCTVSAYNDQTAYYYSIPSFGEHYCESCRCMTGIYASQQNPSTQGPNCFNFTCVNNQSKVKIGYIWYDCEQDGQKIQVTSGFDGYYVCPTPANKWCSQVPSYSSWPSFVSINTSEGSVGTPVSIDGNRIFPC